LGITSNNEIYRVFNTLDISSNGLHPFPFVSIINLEIKAVQFL